MPVLLEIHGRRQFRFELVKQGILNILSMVSNAGCIQHCDQDRHAEVLKQEQVGEERLQVAAFKEGRQSLRDLFGFQKISAVDLSLFGHDPDLTTET
jgi:hypothetical protein